MFENYQSVRIKFGCYKIRHSWIFSLFSFKYIKFDLSVLTYFRLKLVINKLHDIDMRYSYP